MIKKIQKHLLIHYPIIWNIRIVPMLLILIAFHLLFFGIGYIQTDVSFDDLHYFSSPTSDMGALYFTCVLICILLLVGWLIFYNRNNGFKTFYPRKTIQIYLEWIMIFVITAGIAFIPFTLTQGYISKWESVANKEEAEKAMSVLRKAKILIPNEYDSYRYRGELDVPIDIPHNMSFDLDTLDLSLYSTSYNHRNNGIEIEGYIGSSLLFYNDDEYYYNYDDPENIKDYHLVKRWLNTRDKDSIYSVMKDFTALHKKHFKETSITPDEWLERIYNPPFFPVNNSTHISYRKANDEYTIEEYDRSILSASASTPYLEHKKLESGYNHILNCYNEYQKISEVIALMCICIAIMVSVFIYSFRATKGKSWLIALVSAGILIFATVLLAISLFEVTEWRDEEYIVILMILLWITLFISLLSRILIKIKGKLNKGYSNIYINLMVWIMPCFTPLMFFIYALYREANRHNNDYNYEKITDNDITCMIWTNIIIVILAMYGISAVVRKWKSIAEE